jgi:hypothetical protein
LRNATGLRAVPSYVRLLGLFLSLVVVAVAQDARSLVMRAIEVDRQGREAALQYTYLERMETRSIDGSGKVKSTHSRTTDITRLEGSPYRRQVAVDDRPLPSKEEQKEQEKLRVSIEARRKESPEERDRRLADWRRRQEQRRAPLKELPDAFDFHMVGEDTLDGQPVYVIEATPHPGYKPKQSSTAFLTKVKARFWIGKADAQWMKIEMETLDTISFGGVLVRLGKGGHLVIEQAHINNEVWLPKHVLLKASARVMLLVGVREEIEFTFSNYKKFQAESRVVSVGQ